MLENFPFYLGILIVILLLIMLANRIKVAYPVLLVLAGLAISFIPGVPVVNIEPELIFFIFLPPLLYEAAWKISWKEMWRWRRIITSFAFVVVFLSALSVALVANYIIPGFSLALGFLLGGIVSPPDAVSAGAILKFVKLPRTISSILEGESLLNDASSLIIFRFAMIAVATQQFIFYKAALSFSWMIFGGVTIGLLIGWLFMKAHKYLPTDANADIVLSLLTPYIIYLAAEEVHSSGVLAVVSGGLLLSNNRHRFLSSKSRLQGINVWESLCFILNGLVFMLIGLDLPQITRGLEEVTIATAIGYGILITFVLIISRILSSYGAVIVTLIARNFITVADSRNPGFKTPFILGWTGMRGVVSLAAALSIPVYLNNGNGFPQRNLILFITFIVILLTLLIQGLTLPYFIKKIKFKIDDDLPRDLAFNLLRKELAEHASDYLRVKYSDQIQNNPSLQQLIQKWEQHSNGIDDESIGTELKDIYLDLLNQQRKWLINKNKEDQTLDEAVIRRQMHYLDIEEEKLRFI
ncbi:Na+/H+ antiporter [Flavobacterium sp. ACN6]|uniref:Na+/H+ antiporter n=1 Tax=Flavobacterium sp. ACN6 TaxID=1920426 RepID=UPI000BB39513|nr:Na+/H+ antiporter [Flavobacterium sp. ACN6]PBJ15870.1 Sodium, potassium, lithium and rubidium/H(+) antiporter [Flavobacterium sp. ACN6]